MLSNFFLHCLVSKGLWATYKKKQALSFSFGKKIAVQLNVNIFPPGTWAKTMNSTLDTLVQ